MSEDSSALDLVLLLDAKEFSEASAMALADCPQFTAREEGGEN